MHIEIPFQKTFLFILLLLFSYSCKNSESTPPIVNDINSDNSIHISSEKGEIWNVLGVKITGKILSNQTNGEYSIIITETPSNGGPPMHVHKNEDELFYILKGSYIFNCGNKKIQAKQGDIIRLPRGIPHNFVNTDTITGVTMNTITPGGFENFFQEISKSSEVSNLTKQEIGSIANKYGVTFVKK